MRLHIQTFDADTGRKLPVRLSFQGDGLTPFWDKDAAGRDMTYLGLPRVWSDGEWEGDLPDTALTIIVSRPFEYETQQLQVEPSDQQTHTLSLRRRCDPGLEGWFAGDAHQHVVHGEAELDMNLPLAASISQSEGVSWMVYDARFTSIADEAEPGTDELNSLCAAASTQDFVAMWADEYPKHDLGHLAAFPLRRPAPLREVAGEGIYRLEEGMRTPYLNFESIRVLQRHGSTALYSHPLRELGGTPGRVGNLARELPLDAVVAPWALDAIDLFTDQIDDPLCFSMWYGLLNEGHRIGICAFNDACFDRNGDRCGFYEPVAYRRTYVQLRGPVGAEALVEGIRAGRTFGTTGPIVLTDIDGEGPGHVFACARTPRTLTIRAWGAPGYEDPRKDGGIRRVEVIRNGECCKEWTFADSAPKNAELEYTVTEVDSAWYVVRVYGSISEQLAVTSPIYFEQAGHRLPAPYEATVCARIVDADTGAPLQGCMEMVAFDKEHVVVHDSKSFDAGNLLCRVAGDLRLRANVDGYEVLTLSPILDVPEIYHELLGGVRRQDLVDPTYRSRLRAALDRVELTFMMQPRGSAPTPLSADAEQ